MLVQSVLFSRELWGEKGARSWLVKNGYHSGKIHMTKNVLRFRQLEPIFARYMIKRSETFPGVMFVVAY